MRSTMAHTSDKITLTARREALAELAHVLMIDYLRRWNGATKANIRLAKKHLDEVRKIGEPGALAHVVQGQIHEVEGNLKLAIGEWNKALEIDPKLAIAYAHKANAMILQGDAAAALPLVEDALKARDPDSGLLYWFKGRAHFNLGHDNEAEYDKAIECLK